jgi:hypothetical protein
VTGGIGRLNGPNEETIIKQSIKESAHSLGQSTRLDKQPNFNVPFMSGLGEVG